MITLESLASGVSLVGVEPTLVVTLVAVVPVGDGAVTASYKTPKGTLNERLPTPHGRTDQICGAVQTNATNLAFENKVRV